MPVVSQWFQHGIEGDGVDQEVQFEEVIASAEYIPLILVPHLVPVQPNRYPPFFFRHGDLSLDAGAGGNGVVCLRGARRFVWVYLYAAGLPGLELECHGSSVVVIVADCFSCCSRVRLASDPTGTGSMNTVLLS